MAKFITASRSKAALVTLGLVVSFLFAGTRNSWSAENELQVTSDQTTTVRGTFESLADLIAELCRQGQVELRFYNGVDREIRAAYIELPLRKVLERLLADENYLLGEAGGPPSDDPIRVAWLQVSGLGGGGVQVVEKKVGPPPTIPWNQGAEVSSEAAQTMETVSDLLLADDRKIENFIATPAKELADSLQNYPKVYEALVRLSRYQNLPRVTTKLNEVIAELAR